MYIYTYTYTHTYIYTYTYTHTYTCIYTTLLLHTCPANEGLNKVIFDFNVDGLWEKVHKPLLPWRVVAPLIDPVGNVAHL